jgi:hypothetical protein
MVRVNVFLTNCLVGIVFSPTLNIPAPVFSLFITEYDVVFDEIDEPPIVSSTVEDPPPYNAYNNVQNSPPTSHGNYHVGVSESQSHRRFPTSDPPIHASPQPPPSFPMRNQGYREQSQSYQQYQPQQYPYQQQMYSQQQPQSASRWNDTKEESNDLFG